VTKWRREKTQINKIRDEKRDEPQILMRSRESLENTLKTYIQINWKTYKKWMNSQMHITNQNGTKKIVNT
jgi:hypothetical protein